MSETPKRFRFTQRLIETLPPNDADSPSTEAEYTDTQIAGLKCLVGAYFGAFRPPISGLYDR